MKKAEARALDFCLGRVQVANGGEREHGPVERAQVLAGAGRVLADGRRVAPGGHEALPVADQVVEGREPVGAQQDDVREIRDAPEVRERRPVLDCAHPLLRAVLLQEARAPQRRVNAEPQLQRVERRQTQHVEEALARLQVRARRLLRVVHQKALRAVRGPEFAGSRFAEPGWPHVPPTSTSTRRSADSVSRLCARTYST